MIRLILARHGNTFEKGETPLQVGARTDLPLTEEGRKQAERMGEYFISKKIVPRAIYAGPLKRQRETALILAKKWKLETQDAPLTEIDYGAWEGLSSHEIEMRWPAEYADWTKKGKWPEGIFKGTFAEYLAQKEEWLHQLKKNHQSGEIVMGVTSQGMIRSFYPQKVKTGHFCELALYPDRIAIQSWNIEPI